MYLCQRYHSGMNISGVDDYILSHILSFLYDPCRIARLVCKRWYRVYRKLYGNIPQISLSKILRYDINKFEYTRVLIYSIYVPHKKLIDFAKTYGHRRILDHVCLSPLSCSCLRPYPCKRDDLAERIRLILNLGHLNCITDLAAINLRSIDGWLLWELAEKYEYEKIAKIAQLYVTFEPCMSWFTYSTEVRNSTLASTGRWDWDATFIQMFIRGNSCGPYFPTAYNRMTEIQSDYYVEPPCLRTPLYDLIRKHLNIRSDEPVRVEILGLIYYLVDIGYGFDISTARILDTFAREHDSYLLTKLYERGYKLQWISTLMAEGKVVDNGKLLKQLKRQKRKRHDPPRSCRKIIPRKVYHLKQGRYALQRR